MYNWRVYAAAYKQPPCRSKLLLLHMPSLATSDNTSQFCVSMKFLTKMVLKILCSNTNKIEAGKHKLV